MQFQSLDAVSRYREFRDQLDPTLSKKNVPVMSIDRLSALDGRDHLDVALEEPRIRHGIQVPYDRDRVRPSGGHVACRRIEPGKVCGRDERRLDCLGHTESETVCERSY